MTENIQRGLVVRVIGRQILHSVASLDLWEDGAQEEPPEEQERLRLARELIKERIFAFFQLADELGLYEEATAEVVIPQRLLEEYWGSDHPRARRRGG